MLAGCVCGIFLAAMEGTVVGTVMPTIVDQLGGRAQYHQVFAVYMVTGAVTVPIWGKLADLYGTRRLFAVGVLTFLVGSALAGTARSMDALVAFRLVQGLGAGALFALPMTILAHQAPPERRGHMLGIAAATWGVAALLGPPLGAVIVTLADWRWVFYINIPAGLVGLALVWRNTSDIVAHKRHRLDVLGALLIMGGATALLAGTQAWREGTTPLGLQPWTLLAAALVALPLIVFVERRAGEPIVPTHLFRFPIYRVANTGAFLMAFSVFCAIVYMPMMTTILSPEDVLRAGLSLVPASLGWTVGSLVAGRNVARVGARPIAITGAAMGSVGFLLAAQLGPTSPLWLIMPVMFPIGAGIGMTSPPLLVTLQNHLGSSGMGVVTSGMSFYRHLGGTLGITLLGVLVPAGDDPAAVTRGVQHVFLAASLILALTAVFVMRHVPRTIFADPTDHGPDHVVPGSPAASPAGVPRALEDDA